MSAASRALASALWLVLAACGSTGAPDPRAGDVAPADGARAGPNPWKEPAGNMKDATLARVCEDAWTLFLDASPVQASWLGDERYLGELADVSPEGQQRIAARQRELLDRLDAVDAARLAAEEAVTLRLLREQLGDALAEHDLAIDVLAWNLDPRSGPQSDFPTLAADQPVATAGQRAKLVERWGRMPAYVDQCAANLRRGLAAGKVAPRRAVENVLAQVDLILATPPEESPLVAPALASPEDGARLRAELEDLVARRLRPAFARYRAVLADEVLPRARGEDESGVSHVPGGDAWYLLCVRRETGLALSPAEIHEIGLAEVARVRAEIAGLGERVFGTRDVAEVQRRLRADPALHFETSAEVEAKAREALARAQAAVPRAFGRVRPQAPCEVVPIPAHEAPYTTVAYYREPAVDGSRPGRYYVNTYAPTTRTRYEAEVLAFHESVPGHHLQIAIAQELAGLPLVRRHQGSTAFVEGWALYTERLSGELGLYSSDVDRLGVLSFDAWRACRLVVDTGLHALGWTRERAIRYMLENTLLAENNVANEVDRYIATPGQALAYKLGQREILALRELARERLGARFSLAEFHDRVLENGAVTLGVLRDHVERWLAGAAR